MPIPESVEQCTFHRDNNNDDISSQTATPPGSRHGCTPSCKDKDHPHTAVKSKGGEGDGGGLLLSTRSPIRADSRLHKLSPSLRRIMNLVSEGMCEEKKDEHTSGGECEQECVEIVCREVVLYIVGKVEQSIDEVLVKEGVGGTTDDLSVPVLDSSVGKSCISMSRRRVTSGERRGIVEGGECRPDVSPLVSSGEYRDGYLGRSTPSITTERMGDIEKDWLRALSSNNTEEIKRILVKMGAPITLPGEASCIVSEGDKNEKDAAAVHENEEEELHSEETKNINGDKEEEGSPGTVNENEERPGAKVACESKLSYSDLLAYSDPYLRYTPLHWMSKFGNKDIMQIIVRDEKGKETVNDKSQSLCTPLHLAARYSHISAILSLLSCGADASIADMDGNTPEDVCKDSSFELALGKFQRLQEVFGLNLLDVNLREHIIGENVDDDLESSSLSGVMNAPQGSASRSFKDGESVVSSSSSWNTQFGSEKESGYNFRGHRFTLLNETHLGVWRCAHCQKALKSNSTRQSLFSTRAGKNNKSLICMLCNLPCHQKHVKHVAACSGV
eukprot:Nk52_evm36s292 gene=Nk52_evmTU36s292